MKSKFKKGVIITLSAVIFFFAVFFTTKSLNNLIDGSKPKQENTISIEDNSLKEDNKSKDIKEDNKKDGKEKNNEKNDEKEASSKTTINPSTEKYNDYIVKEGDTLYSISRKLMPWVSQEEAVKTLETMNNLKTRELLPVGSHLMIPINTIDKTGCTKYIVKKDESLYDIAKEYLPNVDTNKAIKMIMEKNNISDPSLLSIGLEIYIPTENISDANSED